MKICEYDLFDMSAALAQIRIEPLHPLNERIISGLLSLLTEPDKDNSFEFNRARRKLAEIPGLDKNRWRFAFHDNLYVRFSILHRESIYKVLISVFTALIDVLKSEDKDRIYDLADAVHCLPDIIAENRFTITKSYWKTHLRRYRSKWDKDFLRTEEKQKNSLAGRDLSE